MNLYVRNNKFWFELENLTRLFFPNEKTFSRTTLPWSFRISAPNRANVSR